MKIKFLDGLRGLAAIYVMLGHARWLLWEGFQSGYAQHPNEYTLLDKFLMYFFSLFKYGHECVLFFFVLSGFVIHINLANKLKTDYNFKIDFIQYFYKRVKRIYPPFLLAILITAILDLIGKSYSLSIYNGQTPYALINENIGNTNNEIKTLIGNLFFLYREYFPLFGTNGPTWSLKLEWWFYMVYPLFLLVSRKNIYYSTALVVVLFFASFYPTIWPEQLIRNVFASMICWWLGVLLAEIITGRLFIKLVHFSLFSAIGFAVLMLINRKDLFYDLQIAFLFAALLSFLLWYNKNGDKLSFLDKLKPIGDFSYSLYIIHFPILVFLSGIIIQTNGKLPTHSFYVIGGSIVCILTSYIAHFIVEIPFLKQKNK